MDIDHIFNKVINSIKEYHPNPNMDIITNAYQYSKKVHEGQFRKNGDPYIVHPIEVSLLLSQLHLDEASIITGLLHDTIEDTLASKEELTELFGEEIALLVDGVTKLSKIRFDTDEHKQAENFRKMLVAMAKDIRVILVKLCDRLHNMQTLKHLSTSKQLRIAQETMDIYVPLAGRLGIHWIKNSLEDLSFRYLYPQEYIYLEESLKKFSDERKTYVDDVILKIKNTLLEHNIKSEVYGRLKNLYSIHKKMLLRDLVLEQIYDVIAFRIPVETIGECYQVLGYIHSLWHPIPGRFKDYIAMPKANQYQSLHTSVIGPKAHRIEIQIRTHEMHEIAEEGIAAHWTYKENNSINNENKKNFVWLRQLLEWQRDLTDPNEFLDIVKYDLFTDEVFVFTPQGEVLSLKQGSTPVDFAYSIHTEVGNHCKGAKINGKMRPLRYELKNGDIVDILTSQEQSPSKDWLSFVRTGKARTKIRHTVRGEERKQSKTLGYEILERELRRNAVSLKNIIKTGELDEFIKQSRYKTQEDVFIALGYGKITPKQILEKFTFKKQKLVKEQSTLTHLFRKITKRPSDGVLIQGMDNVLVRYGKCCSPLHGESIVGFVTRGRGITVHTAMCSRAIDSDPERKIHVSWDNNSDVIRPISLRILTANHPGVLATISQTFSDSSINISQANCKVTETDRAINTFEIWVKNSEELRKVLIRIKRLKGVISANRL